MGTNYIPRNDNQFLVWLKNLIAYLQTKIAEWSLPATEITAMSTLADKFDTALKVAETPATRTAVTVQAKNDARKAAESKTRVIVKGYVTYNPLVTDPDRDAMGLPIHKTTRTSVPDPHTFPTLEIRLPAPAVVECLFHDAESASKAKPPGVHGAEFGWAILEAPPEGWKALVHSSFHTHSPLRLTFEGPDRGKTLYLAARWENTRGAKGPWCEIVSVIIP
jgi:hypothetical protein